MNNGEYLRTLNNEEMARAIYTIWFPNRQHISLIDHFNCLHTTTADEDFEAIGWIKKQEGTAVILYVKVCTNDERHICITKDNIFYKANGLYTNFTDSEIDQIRTIADKKRREMGWDK